MKGTNYLERNKQIKELEQIEMIDTRALGFADSEEAECRPSSLELADSQKAPQKKRVKKLEEKHPLPEGVAPSSGL